MLKNKTAIGLQDVVLSVNRQNRYMHPAPEVFLGLLEVLGPEHVFVTDSDIGENVRIDSAGTTDGRKPGDHLARLRSFAVAQRDRYEAKIRQSMQTGTADAAIAVTARWNAVSQESADKRKKSPIEPRLRDLLEAVLAYDKSIAILDARRDGRAWQATLFRPKRRPPPLPGPPARCARLPPHRPGGPSGSYPARGPGQ